MHMIATIYDSNTLRGYRILESDTGKIMDVTEAQLITALKSGNKINNIEIRRGKLKGSNGDIERYTKVQFSGNTVLNDSNKASLVILNQIGENGYTVSDHIGNIKKAKESDVIAYALKHGIANGKVSTRNGTNFISTISGTYDKIEIASDIKVVEQPIVEKKTEIIDKVKPEVKPEVMVIDNTNKENETTSIDTKGGYKLAFSEEQLSVLKRYYSDANLSPEEATEEILYIDKQFDSNKLKDAYNNTILLNEFLTKLGSSFNIALAFGSDIGTHLVSFVKTGLPMPKSLVKAAINIINLDKMSFYKCLFREFEEAVEIILKSDGSDTMRLAAKLYINYITNRTLMGKYAGFETAEEDYNKKFIEQYAFCTEFTFNELRALVGTIDLMKELSGEIDDTVIEALRIRNKQNELFQISALYTNDLNISDISVVEKRAIMDAIGFNREYYSKGLDSVKGKSAVMIDKDFEVSPHKAYENCLYDSAPLNKRQVGVTISIEKSIANIYAKQLYVLDIGHSLLAGRLRSYVYEYYKEISDAARLRQREEGRLELERIAKEQSRLREERRIKDEEARLKREEERKQEILREEAKAKQEEELARNREKATEKPVTTETTTNGNSLNKMQIDIQSGSDLSTYDRVELYKELKSQAKESDMKDICFTISNDMISRNITYGDMSKKQRFRLEEAIGKLTNMMGIKNKQPTKQEDKKSDTEEEENNTYILDEHPEIRNNVNKLIEKADSVEMSAVIKKEPYVLKICYSILRYKRASDKQLKHVNNAIKLLSEQ